MPVNRPGWTRRGILGAVGASLGGASMSGTVVAQASGSVDIADQESDGESIVVASLSTSVDALVLVWKNRDEQIADFTLDAGESVTDREVSLDTPIQQTAEVRVDLLDEESKEVLDTDRATVTVGDSSSDGESSIPFPEQTEFIQPNPDVGFRLPYALYKPETRPDDPRPLFVEPLNDRAVETEAELRSQVRDAIRAGLFRDLDLPAIVPALPRTPEDGGDRIQALHLPSLRSDASLEEYATDAFSAESLRRVDQQVVRMVEDAKARLSDDDYPVASTIHMNGFSGSAQFSARFAFLYPSLVNAISVGGNGAYPLPKASIDGTELPYPLGTADYETITGRAFDPERWSDIAQFIYVGEDDQPLPSNDQRGYYPVSYRFEDRVVNVFGRNRVTERWPTTESAYKETGANVTFRVYGGVGHRKTRDMITDIEQFHRENLDTASERAPPTDLILPDAGTSPSEPDTGGETDTDGTTGTATETDTTADGNESETDNTSASGSGPGFGIGTTLTSLGTGAYLFARHLERDSDE